MARKKQKENNSNGLIPVLFSGVEVYYDTTLKDYLVFVTIEGKHYRFVKANDDNGG